ncbi:MAG TPA: DUF116 domain-containing protein [Firmicutes bacterium]|nr:DUF116 domain-containing protein [Bacillota bacterium]
MAKKRLILGLALVVLISLGGVAGRLWYVSFNGLDKFSRYFFFSIGLVFLLFTAIALLGVVGVAISIFCHRPLPLFDRPVNVLITRLLPLTMWLGRLLHVTKEKLERSFIEINNALVRTRGVKVSPAKMLVLAPHCLQYSGCRFKITADINNCHHCGRCQVGDLIDLTQELGVNLAVVTGGTLARKKVRELSPEAIVAVACERDLSSGLQDVYPLPAFGVLNQRPNGPCVDTRVDLERLRQVIKTFTRSKAGTLGVS